MSTPGTTTTTRRDVGAGVRFEVAEHSSAPSGRVLAVTAWLQRTGELEAVELERWTVASGRSWRKITAGARRPAAELEAEAEVDAALAALEAIR